MPLLHAFCCVVSSAIVADTAETPLEYLPSLTTRVIFNSAEGNEISNSNERRKEVANLVFIRRGKNRESVGEMRRTQKEVEEVLGQFGLAGVGELHRELALLRLSTDAFEG